MTKLLVTDEMMADLLESDTDGGKEVKEGVTPETNLLPPEGAPTIHSETGTPWRETFEEYEDKVMEWAEEPWFLSLFFFLLVWSLAWKGLALWKAARNNQLYWFVGLLLINTAGIIEIGYLRWGQRKALSQNNLN